MKKTKIVCSIGPSSNTLNTFMQMIEAGMNVARINFSHADDNQCEEVVNLVEEANKVENNHIAIMYDTKGPDFRTGILQNGQIELKEGAIIQIVKEDIIGTEEKITVNYKSSIDTIKIGDTVLIEDGNFKLIVVDKDENSVSCRIIVGGTLGDKKGINIPGVELNEPFLSKTDIRDIKYACNHGGDFIALSFVSCKEDVLAVKELIEEEGSNMKIISKIESISAIKNIDEIIEVSAGIMVARGDLGVEVPMSELPILQKTIIKKCREKGRFCIVATEMLSSMTQKVRPTRAEISDVANAVLDGTDAVMLSNETTIGKYPVEAVEIMAETCENVEKYLDYDHQILPTNMETVMKTIAHSVVLAANSLEVAAILTSTLSGRTARRISTLRPKSIILATCTSEEVSRSLAFHFGVYTSVVPMFHTTDEIIENAIFKGKEILGLEKGDRVVVVGGFPQAKRTNFMKIEEI
jgi:pyruvate kinase